MPIYQIYWTVNNHYTMRVEADSKDDALERFYDGNFDAIGSVSPFDTELEDSVEVRVVNPSFICP